jgi:predicted CoA-binding protein
MMPSKTAIEDFMAQRRLAFVGVSHDPKDFSVAVYHQLAKSGYELVPINAHGGEVDGTPMLRSVAELAEPVDGAIVMVRAEAAAGVVRECIDAGVPRVWLHKGAGTGAVSDEAVALCREHGVEVIDGACPMMFAEPVGWFHRVHHFGRTLAGAWSE